MFRRIIQQIARCAIIQIAGVIPTLIIILADFPLTGAHQTVDCSGCHQNGFAGTPTDCVSCHQSNFNSTTNPNHQAIGITTDCQTCHTTNPGWQPATFPIHNNFYELIGAHANITDCSTCHNGNYNNTPNQCYDCHVTDYNNTTNPNHQAAGFGTDCQTCHSQVCMAAGNL